MRTTKHSAQATSTPPGSKAESSRAANRPSSRIAHRSRRDHDPATDTGISGIALCELIPTGASNRKIRGHELLRAVEVLNELKRRIDGDAEFAITHRGKWYLQAARTASITKTAIWQMESVELVIRNLLQWYAVIGDRKPSRRTSAQSAKGRSK